MAETSPFRGIMAWYNVSNVADEKEEFLPLDSDLLREAENGGRDASSKVSTWARKRFDSWREFAKKQCLGNAGDIPQSYLKYLDRSVLLEDIPPRDLNFMLVRFMLEVKKVDNKLYPSGSLNCLYRAIGRILRKQQEKRVGQTRIAEPALNILHSDLYREATYAFVGSARRSRMLGVGVKHKKAPEITFQVEQDLLSDLDHSISHSRGVKKRLCFYIATRFGIRGAREMHGLMDVDFTLDSDSDGEYVLYQERGSKNYQTSETKYDDKHFRPPIWTHEADFVLSYKQYTRHLPPKDQDKPRHFFLNAIVNARGSVWYQRVPAGEKKVRGWIKAMGTLINIPEISNKSGRVSLVSRLSFAGVPPEIGMLVTGHKTLDGYQKYDRSREVQINAAMSILAKPFNDDGSRRLFVQVLEEEMQKKRVQGGMHGASSSGSALVSSDDNLIVTNLRATLSHNPPTLSHSPPTLSHNPPVIPVPVIPITHVHNTIPAAHNTDMVLTEVDSNQITAMKTSRKDLQMVGKENYNVDNGITNEFLDEALKSWPEGRKAISTELRDISVNNSGGQSFVGGTINNFFINSPDLKDMNSMIQGLTKKC